MEADFLSFGSILLPWVQACIPTPFTVSEGLTSLDSQAVLEKAWLCGTIWGGGYCNLSPV